MARHEDRARRTGRTAKGRGASARVPVQAPGRPRGRLLRRALFTLLGGAVAVLVALNARNVYDKLDEQKIEIVRIEGSLHYVSRAEVERAVQVFRNRSMVSVDLQAVQAMLEGHPWVRQVGVRREWPNSLIVEVTEQVPIARWGENSLLNQSGEIFRPQDMRDKAALPLLLGPEGSAPEVMGQYQKFSQLLYPLGMKLSSLELNDRDAWSFRLDSGVEVKVGKNRVMEKMRRFAGFVDRHFRERLALVETIDLRYSNGIAVRERELEEEVVSL